MAIHALARLPALTTPTYLPNYLGAYTPVPKPPPVTPVLRPLAARITSLEGLLGLLYPVPDAWLLARADTPVSQCLPCTNWADLIGAWRRALKWIEGLDVGLSVMLAAVTSTKSVGTQLWVKVIGPAGCLDGDTPIYDPLDGTTKTIAERHLTGVGFNVWSQDNQGDLVVKRALPPVKYPKQQIYEVQFQSGKTLRITSEHQLWNGSSYVAVGTISHDLDVNGPYRLPTTLGLDLLAHEPSVHRLKQTTEGSQSHCFACSYQCDEQPLQEAGSVLCAAPLQGDAQGRSRFLHAGDLAFLWRCNRLAPTHDDHPSKNHFLDLAWLLQCVVEYGCLAFADACEQWLCLFENALHKLTGIDQTHRVLLALPSGLASSGSHSLLHSLSESYKYSFGWYPIAWQSYLGLVLEQRDVSTCPTSLEGRDGYVCLRDGTLHPLALGSALKQSIQFLTPYSIQQMCTRLCKVLQRGQSFLDPSKQPSVSPLLVVRQQNQQYCTATDYVTQVVPIKLDFYYDFHVPETNNYWAEGLFHHNCGKSTLCEALSVNAQYVVAKSTFRGFHSGFSTNDGQDHSLIGKLNGKTFIVKDGDTLLQSPNLGQILSEGRDLFDTVSRSDYRTGRGKDWSGIRITWLLCGTSSLRLLDESELGERFLDCVIMEGIDDDLEDEILWRAVNREANNIGMEADGEMTSHNEPAMVEAMQLTGGYVDHLRENATRLLGMTTIDREHRHLCTRLGKFTSYMRARPSKKQDEESERELAARLTVQLVRLAMCLAVVLNKDTVDDEVVRRVHKVAMDTSRGITLQIVTLLSKAPLGMEARGIGIHTSRTEDGIRKHLRFLKQIGVVEINNDHIKGGAKTRANCWRLTPRIEQLYKEVTTNG